MTSQNFLDPRDTIDRETEQELFAGLVSFKTPARMLVISDTVDRGKSTLLRRLEYNCKWVINPPVSACLVDLSQLKDPSPFGFIEEVVKGLNIEQRYSKFISLNRARAAKNFSRFDTPYAAIHGEVTVKDGAEGTAYGINIEQAVEAFFDHLRVLCATQPIVILLDHWEKCYYQLRDWIKATFLQKHCFHPNKNLRPAKLAIVLAGNSYDKAKERFGIRELEFVDLFKHEQEYKETVLLIGILSEWDSVHVREFLKQHGHDKLSDADIDMICDLLKRGYTLTLQKTLDSIVHQPFIHRRLPHFHSITKE
jgi:hypothetical protein